MFERRLFMRWQCRCDFIVPPGLLWVFPEFSLVRRNWRRTMHMFEAIGVAFLVAVEVHRNPGCRNAPWMQST
jgi:hypothetical protein